MNLRNWTTETDNDGIVWMRLDKADSKANVLSAEVLEELHTLLLPLQAKLLKQLHQKLQLPMLN